MPYVLWNRETGEVAAAVLRNVYDLEYYGAEWWETEEEAARAAASRPGWMPRPVDASRLKLFNVKLNNDSGRRLYWDEDGTIRIKTSSAE